MECYAAAYLEGKGTSLLSNFLHEGLVHWRFGDARTRRWVHLNALYPDVSPEGQPNNIQVIASIAEGTSKVDKYCNGKRCVQCDLCAARTRKPQPFIVDGQ